MAGRTAETIRNPDADASRGSVTLPRVTSPRAGKIPGVTDFQVAATVSRHRGRFPRGRFPPTATSMVAIRNDHLTSIRDVRSLGSNVALRVELTRSKLLSWTAAPGAT